MLYIRCVGGTTMTLVEIRKIASSLGLKNFIRMRKADLIRKIQIAEGNSDCFGKIPTCQQNDCLWMKDCKKEVKRL